MIVRSRRQAEHSLPFSQRAKWWTGLDSVCTCLHSSDFKSLSSHTASYKQPWSSDARTGTTAKTTFFWICKSPGIATSRHARVQVMGCATLVLTLFGLATAHGGIWWNSVCNNCAKWSKWYSNVLYDTSVRWLLNLNWRNSCRRSDYVGLFFCVTQVVFLWRHRTPSVASLPSNFTGLDCTHDLITAHCASKWQEICFFLSNSWNQQSPKNQNRISCCSCSAWSGC